MEYLDGNLSAVEAQSKYRVTAATFSYSYWENKVEDSEYPAVVEAERAAQQAREIAATPQSRKSKEPPLDKADEWEKYFNAYIHMLGR